jgi:hypothetical protein
MQRGLAAQATQPVLARVTWWSPTFLNHLPVEEAQRRQRSPGTRQFGAVDRPDFVAWCRLPGGPQEVRVSPNLLFAPRLVSQSSEPIGKDLSHASGAAQGRDDSPKRVIARRIQADRFNHPARLTRLLAKIKRDD